MGVKITLISVLEKRLFAYTRKLSDREVPELRLYAEKYAFMSVFNG